MSDINLLTVLRIFYKKTASLRVGGIIFVVPPIEFSQRNIDPGGESNGRNQRNGVNR